MRLPPANIRDPVPSPVSRPRFPPAISAVPRPEAGPEYSLTNPQRASARLPGPQLQILLSLQGVRRATLEEWRRGPGVRKWDWVRLAWRDLGRRRERAGRESPGWRPVVREQEHRGQDRRRYRRGPGVRKWDWVVSHFLRIPAMPITDSDLMAITIPSDADHRRSEATLGCSY